MPEDNATILKCIVIYIYLSHSNPLITDWVQNVTMLGLFFDSSRWYKATILQVFLFVLWSPVSQDYHYAANILLSLGCCMFFLIWVDHFLPVLPLISQEPRTEKVIGYVTSAQGKKKERKKRKKKTTNSCMWQS